jgi:hypothetical protein
MVTMVNIVTKITMVNIVTKITMVNIVNITMVIRAHIVINIKVSANPWPYC